MNKINFTKVAFLFIGTMSIAIASVMVWIGIGYYTGVVSTSSDLRIIEFSVCTDILSSSHLEQTIHSDIKQIAICGNAQGASSKSTVVYWYYEDEVIHQVNTRIRPDSFRILLPPKNKQTEYDIGDYRVKIVYARQTLAETNFSIIR